MKSKQKYFKTLSHLVLAALILGMGISQLPSRSEALEASKRIKTELPFDPTKDGLCFDNTGFADVAWPLGKIADKKGACQGMSGIVAATHRYVSFDPQGPKMSEGAVLSRIQDAVNLYTQGCNDYTCQKGAITITGFSSLKKACEPYVHSLKSLAVYNNAAIAQHDILPLLPEFLYPEDNNEKWSKHNLATVRSIYADLKQGRPALLLYVSHVIAVYGIEEVQDASGKLVNIKLMTWNPNSSNQTWDSWVTVLNGNQIDPEWHIWDITPGSPADRARDAAKPGFF
ncbi:hypothetical protein WDW86_05850 [Bdellovibrionota bacterium FG-2]